MLFSSFEVSAADTAAVEKGRYLLYNGCRRKEPGQEPVEPGLLFAGAFHMGKCAQMKRERKYENYICAARGTEL